MEKELALWMVAASIVPATAFAFAVKARLLGLKKLGTSTKQDTSLLVTMHQSPDEYGFGSGETNEVQKDNTRAIKEMTHYLIVSIKNQTGQDPLPPLDL